MITCYIIFLVLCILIFGIVTVLLLILNTAHSDRRDTGRSTWFLKIIILIICICSFKFAYYITNKPLILFCTDEPVSVNKGIETYVYYNFFHTDSVIKHVHKHEYVKAIVIREKKNNDSNDPHMHIWIKSGDGKYIINNYCTRSEDLPYNEFKKRIAFKKSYWPDTHYELVYF